MDVQLSAQHVLDCSGAGDCHGGSVDGTYQWLYRLSTQSGVGVAYETVSPYLACASDSQDGLCALRAPGCSAENVAKMCSRSPLSTCVAVSRYPNATIIGYGSIAGASAMQREIFHRGPIACTLSATALLDYTGGIVEGSPSTPNHAVSVVGWGVDAVQGNYWQVRNSWGEAWGEMGFFRVRMGTWKSLGIENHCVWAVPSEVAPAEFGCFFGGWNCQVLPANNIVSFGKMFLIAVPVLCCLCCRRK